MVYKITLGLWKSLKNTLVVGILPAFYLLCTNISWVPKENMLIMAPILGYIGYFIKNYIENRE